MEYAIVSMDGVRRESIFKWNYFYFTRLLHLRKSFSRTQPQI